MARDKYTAPTPLVAIRPTPDAERVVMLVKFGFEALEYFRQTKAMFDELIEKNVIEVKGEAGDWVDRLYAQGLQCFPVEETATKEKTQ